MVLDYSFGSSLYLLKSLSSSELNKAFCLLPLLIGNQVVEQDIPKSLLDDDDRVYW